MKGGSCSSCSGGSGSGAGGGQGSGGSASGGQGSGQTAGAGGGRDTTAGGQQGGQSGETGGSGSAASGRSGEGGGSPGGSSGGTGSGADEPLLAGTPSRGSPIPDRELEDVLQDIRVRLEEEELPEEMLRELGMNRTQLEEFLRGYLDAPDDSGEDGPEPAEEEAATAGRVLDATGRRSADVTVADAAAAQVRKDEMRSRFEDASGRISPRYRDAVNAYYKRLSQPE